MKFNRFIHRFKNALAKSTVLAMAILSINSAVNGAVLTPVAVYADTNTTGAASTVNWPEAPEIESGSAVLIDADTGAILYEKDAHRTSFPASTTKILTGLLVIENCNLSDVVTFSREAANSVAYDEANLGTRAGEQMTVEQALYGLLLHSANEIAYGLAEHVSGSVEDFVELMNQRAQEVGALDTHFINSSGLHNENHYTTPYDLALIARECYNNTTFVNIDSTYTTYNIPPTNKYKYNRFFKHRHEMLKNRKYYYEYCRGGKTGYTSDADYTLVTFAEKDGIRLICVCFQSGADSRFTDTRTLFDWGFDNFKKVTASSSDMSSIFSSSNLYNSKVFNNLNYRFNISTSTLTLPEGVSVGEITLDIPDNAQPSTDNGIYSTDISYKYKDYTVGTAKLTIATDDAFVANSKLPYLSETNDIKLTPKKKLVINVWWLVLAGVIALIILYVISEVRRRKRYSHVRRRTSRRSYSSKRPNQRFR